MSDIIARLYPSNEGDGGLAHRTIRSKENHSRFVIPKLTCLDLPGRNSRESTAPLDDVEDIKSADISYEVALELTFTHGPKAAPGFTFGTDLGKCNIVLPLLPGITRRHCYLTFNTEQRIILRDCSKYGTTVEYDGEGGQRRSNFTWIVGGHRHADATYEIVLQLHASLQFQIEILVSPSQKDHNKKVAEDDLVELLSCMVTIEPAKRWSATQCLRSAARLHTVREHLLHDLPSVHSEAPTVVVPTIKALKSQEQQEVIASVKQAAPSTSEMQDHRDVAKRHKSRESLLRESQRSAKSSRA